MPLASKYKNNKAHYAQWQRDYRSRYPTFSGKLRRLYGRAECQRMYEHFMKAQNGCCAICGKDDKRKLHLDHSHKTNEIRGLLCWGCNTKLGWVEKWMKQIVIYLKGTER